MKLKMCFSEPSQWGERLIKYIVVSDHFSIQDNCEERTVTDTGVEDGPAVTDSTAATAPRILMDASGSTASAEDLCPSCTKHNGIYFDSWFSLLVVFVTMFFWFHVIHISLPQPILTLSLCLSLSLSLFLSLILSFFSTRIVVS
ncbi:unnamed protein product [Polarella glacialis]|uniref:Uncharacterized protein n=1 Tax=Polarella glacialis TaxID=89957 RepID=A0A813IGW8_POLGL|nr:unnamed protein product [Polarella glacialis]